jgi:PAS domain-containing protein
VCPSQNGWGLRRPCAELARKEFFNDFLLRFHAAHALFGAGRYLGGSYEGLSMRRRGTHKFSESAHKRAYRIHFELASLKDHNFSLQAALDSSLTAIFLISHNSRVIAMNRAAQTILDQKDGLVVRQPNNFFGSTTETSQELVEYWDAFVCTSSTIRSHLSRRATAPSGELPLDTRSNRNTDD